MSEVRFLKELAPFKYRVVFPMVEVLDYINLCGLPLVTKIKFERVVCSDQIQRSSKCRLNLKELLENNLEDLIVKLIKVLVGLFGNQIWIW